MILYSFLFFTELFFVVKDIFLFFLFNSLNLQKKEELFIFMCCTTFFSPLTEVFDFCLACQSLYTTHTQFDGFTHV